MKRWLEFIATLLCGLVVLAYLGVMVLWMTPAADAQAITPKEKPKCWALTGEINRYSGLQSAYVKESQVVLRLCEAP